MNRIALGLLLLSLPAFAQHTAPGQDAQPVPPHPHHHWTIDLASALVPWCRSEAEARYVALGMTPYQWRARYHDKGNALFVDGRLRVDGDDIDVRCRIARGAREEYAVIEIDDPRMQALGQRGP